MSSSICEKIVQIQDSLGQAKLLAVSKTKSKEMILEALSCGHRDFGENKVQELLLKSQELSKENINWHFIGHLQTNKLNQLLAVQNLVSIHSIGSIKLLNKLLSKTPGKKIGIFLQINTSEEEQKGGFDPFDDFTELINSIDMHKSFYFQGFMTIGKIRTNAFEEDAHKSFKLLEKLKKDYGHNRNIELSMGMSNDYKIALAYGTNWVRIGSNIFGNR